MAETDEGIRAQRDALLRQVEDLEKRLRAAESERAAYQNDAQRLRVERDLARDERDAAIGEEVRLTKCCDELTERLQKCSATPAPVAPCTGEARAPAVRRKMDDDRASRTVTLRINDRSLQRFCPTCEQLLPDSPRCTSFTMHVGYREDGTIGEFFLRPSHDEKTDLIASLADSWAQNASFALQHGADLKWILEHARYCADGSGGTPLVWDKESQTYKPHPAFKRVKSITDYAARVIDRLRQGKPAGSLTEAEKLAKQKALEAEVAAKEAEAAAEGGGQ